MKLKHFEFEFQGWVVLIAMLNQWNLLWSIKPTQKYNIGYKSPVMKSRFIKEIESETFSVLGTHDTMNYVDGGGRKIQFSVLD